jgi:DNA primase
MVLARGLSCSVVLLPDKEDIDSLLHSQGRDAFEDLRRFAPDGLDFCIRSLSRQAPREALDWVKSFLSGVQAPELVSRYVSRLSQGLDLDERALRRDLPVRVTPVPAAGPPGKGGGIPRPSVGRDAFDQALMNFVVRFPHHLPALREAGAALLLSEGWTAALWDKVEKCGPAFAPEMILQELDDREKEFWGRYRVMLAPPPEHEQEELAAILSVIARRCLERQEATAAQVLHQGLPAADDADLLRALNETLLQKRKHGSSHG